MVPMNSRVHTGWFKKDGNICFPYQRKPVHGICIILRIPTSFHGNFFGIRLNISSIFLLHSGEHTAEYLCFTCTQFCEELNYVTHILSFMHTRETSLGKPLLDYLT